MRSLATVILADAERNINGERDEPLIA